MRLTLRALIKPVSLLAPPTHTCTLTKSPFFGDALSISCTNTNEQLYADEQSEYSFFSSDGGFTLDARCPDENEIITKISMCVTDGHVQVATISCSGLKDPDTVEERYEATSDERKNTFVNCGDSSAIQSMNLADAGDGITTSKDLRCLKIL
ncbi:hypothetical protein AVEN_130987-1 [Araneus ventricosus]|uniref:Uncharacterized protein n=1 Tax=Araneus ventricosus TaxID=182803 RepID=A0A4Y2NYP3_ARAVE|nr:hypothetical protein AVEN_130987-1 [Araneus ventricosus]